MRFLQVFVSIDNIPAYGKPWKDTSDPSCLLQVQSKDDDWVKVPQAQKLFDTATGVPSSCKTFFEYEGALHTDNLFPKQKEEMSTWLNEQRDR